MLYAIDPAMRYLGFSFGLYFGLKRIPVPLILHYSQQVVSLISTFKLLFSNLLRSARGA